MKKSVILTAIVLASIIAFAGCGVKDISEEASGEAVIADKTNAPEITEQVSLTTEHAATGPGSTNSYSTSIKRSLRQSERQIYREELIRPPFHCGTARTPNSRRADGQCYHFQRS